VSRQVRSSPYELSSLFPLERRESQELSYSIEPFPLLQRRLGTLSEVVTPLLVVCCKGARGGGGARQHDAHKTNFIEFRCNCLRNHTLYVYEMLHTRIWKKSCRLGYNILQSIENESASCHLLSPWFVAWLSLCTLKKEAVSFSETCVDFQCTIHGITRISQEIELCITNFVASVH
jgi:hypothetical protein